MKKHLFVIIALLTGGLSISSAINMSVIKENGEIFKFNVDEIKEVIFEEPQDSSVVDPIPQDTTAIIPIPEDTTDIDSTKKLDFNVGYGNGYVDGMRVYISATGGSGLYNISVNCVEYSPDKDFYDYDAIWHNYVDGLYPLSSNEWELLLYAKYLMTTGGINQCNGKVTEYDETTDVYKSWVRICVIDLTTKEEVCKDICLDYSWNW